MSQHLEVSLRVKPFRSKTSCEARDWILEPVALGDVDVWQSIVTCAIYWIHKRLKTGGTTEVLPLIYWRDPTDCRLCFYYRLWVVGLESSTGNCRLQVVVLESSTRNCGLWTMDSASRGFYRSLGLWSVY